MLEILELSKEISNYAICGEGNVSVRFENGFLVNLVELILKIFQKKI